MCKAGPNRALPCLSLVQLRHKPAFLYLPQDRTVDELFRLSGFGVSIALGQPGELGSDPGERHMGNLRVELTVETINVFQLFAVIDLEIFAPGANRR